MKTAAPTKTISAARPVVPSVGAGTLGAARGIFFRLIAWTSALLWRACR